MAVRVNRRYLLAATKRIECFQHLFGPRPDSSAFRQIHPPNRAGSINQELAWTSDVRALRSSFRMQKIVTANHLRLRI